jgi:SAM-dependent methyltransferase
MRSKFESYIKKAFKRAGYNIRRSSSGGYRILRLLVPENEEKFYLKYYPAKSLSEKRFYNVGAGDFEHPFWTNLDMREECFGRIHTDYTEFDLESLKPLPVENNSAEIIYSSHTIEHISNAAAQNLFNEAFRVLKPGGILRFCTPDVDLEYAAYIRSDRSYFYMIDTYSSNSDAWKEWYSMPLDQASLEQIFIHHFASQASMLNLDPRNALSDKKIREVLDTKPKEAAFDYFISLCDPVIQKRYPENHWNWWNEAKARKMLQLAGFTTIFRSGYGQSFAPVLRDVSIFDSTHPKISLYMEAIR